MDKETLSNYGWIVICVLVLAVMIALAGPFGNFVADAVKSTTQGLFDVNQSALNSANVPGLIVEDQRFENDSSTTIVRFGEPYSGICTVATDTTSQCEWIFYENGSAEMKSDYLGETMYAPEGTFIYEGKEIKHSDITATESFTLSDDGNTLYWTYSVTEIENDMIIKSWQETAELTIQ